MQSSKLKTEDRILTACAYVFFAPALYLILTGKRRVEYIAIHSGQAILLWAAIAFIYIALRFIYALMSGLYYIWMYDDIVKLAHLAMWGYAFYCGYLALNSKDINIPVITDFVGRIT